jgi:hypothetical protein
MIGQPGSHRRRARPPQPGRAPAIGDFGHQQRLAQTGVGQDKVVRDLEEHQLIGVCSGCMHISCMAYPPLSQVPDYAKLLPLTLPSA